MIQYRESVKNVSSIVVTAAVLLVWPIGLTLQATSARAAESESASSLIRPINEQGNNVAHPNWGTPGVHLLRGSSGPHYGDGISTLNGASRPSPRAITQAIFAQSGSIPSRTGLSDFIWTWGQFLDHDLSLTEGSAESAPIAIPAGDPAFDPANTGTQVMPFHRGTFDPTTGNATPREQVNQLTGFIDGSMVYGSSDNRATWLRTMSGGRLKVSTSATGDLLPFNDGEQPNAGSPEKPDLSTSLFVAGDIRSNEQPTLACMHTLFVREHNRLAGIIASRQRSLSDEQIYQRARQMVIAEIQHISYDEFLPALLGDDALGDYRGYDPRVDASVKNVFSGAAFRLGHTLLSPVIQRLEEDGSAIADGPLSLRASFFNATPPILVSEGLEPFFRGLAAQRSQELDAKVIDDVRNFLFGAPGQGGLDLIALNVQRGRELGLPDFNTARADLGLPRKRTFREITSDPAQLAALTALYHNVNDIDVFVGLLVEDDVPNGIVGETLKAVLVEQFSRSRAGDRFWYERALSASDLSEIKRTSLSDVIKRNTRVRHLQRNAFFVRGAHGNALND